MLVNTVADMAQPAVPTVNNSTGIRTHLGKEMVRADSMTVKLTLTLGLAENAKTHSR